MPEDQKIARTLIEEYLHIFVTKLLHNNCLSFRQLKCGESDMTYLARNTVNPLPYDIFKGTQPMACGLFGPTEMTTLSVLKTILMM